MTSEHWNAKHHLEFNNYYYPDHHFFLYYMQKNVINKLAHIGQHKYWRPLYQ